MTSDRDIERVLGRWLADGPTEVSDRVFDDAVDRIRRTRQRPAWRLRWRNMQMPTPIRLAAAAASVVLIGVLGFALVGRPGEPAGPAATATPQPSFTVQDIERIVLGAADAPAGSTFSGSTAGPDILLAPVFYISRGSERERFVQQITGFVDARSSMYEGASQDDPLFVSEALLFEDADAASSAMAIYAEEYRTGYGFADPEPSDPSLGDESVLFAGPAAVQSGEPGFYYMWRVGNVLLNAVSAGLVTGDAVDAMRDATLAMALEMDRRAGSAPGAGPTPPVSATPPPTPTAALTPEVCQPSEPTCTGLLAAGVHATGSILTPFTFRVPEGWSKPLDVAGAVNLAYGDPVQGEILVWPDWVVADQDQCTSDPEPGVGRAVDDLVTWLTEHPGLITSSPIPVSIGGLDGRVLDVRKDPAWTGPCSGRVSLFTHKGTIDDVGWWDIDDATQMRLYFLAAGEGHVVNVDIQAATDSFESFAEVATPIVETFDFTP